MTDSPIAPDAIARAIPTQPYARPWGVLWFPDQRERRDPTDKDFADPRFDVIWDVIKRCDVDFGNGLRSGATGNDVCAILDRLDRANGAQ